ncbi:serpin family protein [Rhizohabitans arisaemae]|uniref:serpin family protein n=1 Tax=Rhizohabitans arisaemae TaxID=2720610 RepID=UPI0024B232CF|nr:serpin family protein [Rhizohabitans arisaemae]
MGKGRTLITVATAGLLLASCGGSPARQSSDGVLRAEGVSREIPKDAPVEETVAGLAKFAGELHRVSTDPNKNAVTSPLSIVSAFAMARAGALGDTGTQMDRVFGFPAEGVHEAINDLTRQIVTGEKVPPAPANAGPRTEGPPAAPVVTVANGLFTQRGTAIGEEFLGTLARQYGAGVRTVDFTSPDAIKIMDAWVREQTADRIKKLFDQLDPSTKVVLANAVYLKADWKTPFAKHPVKPGTFTRADGTTVQAPMMNEQGPMRHAAVDGWDVVELPYAGDELAMWVMVPKTAGPAGPQPTSSLLSKAATELRTAPVDFSMPKWDIKTELNLIGSLRKLGLTTPFTPGADFSGITQGVWIGQATHLANITVDEWGTEAAAVTGLAFPTSATVPPNITVRADRPFAFAVMHLPTRAPLFIGHVADPTK